MPMISTNPAANAAIVARHSLQCGRAEEYLVLAPSGAESWSPDSRVATTFASMREATRAAFRLSAAKRAFSLPLPPNLRSMACEPLVVAHGG